VADGIATISGLQDVLAGELITVGSANVQGLALNLESRQVRVVLFANEASVKQGDVAQRTQSIVSVPVGMEILGRVVDALGNPLDDLDDITVSEFS
jgi:F0F1-type ATP synthase alpha subunit